MYIDKYNIVIVIRIFICDSKNYLLFYWRQWNLTIMILHWKKCWIVIKDFCKFKVLLQLILLFQITMKSIND